MAVVITASECEQIRKAIDVRLDVVTLPNTTILLDIYAGYAVRHMVSRLPATYDSALEPTVLTAAIYYCASLIVIAMKQPQVEQIAGNEQRYFQNDLLKKSKELENRANQIIDGVLDIIGGDTNFNSVRPDFFTLAKANRANRTDRW